MFNVSGIILFFWWMRLDMQTINHLDVCLIQHLLIMLSDKNKKEPLILLMNVYFIQFTLFNGNNFIQLQTRG